MMSKSIRVGFFCCALLFGACQETVPTKNCVEVVLEADEELGTNRNEVSLVLSLDEAIDVYVSGTSKLDFSDCPKEFEVAFRGHIEAWKQMQNFTRNYPDLRGEMHDLFDQLAVSKDSVRFRELESEIWQSWARVEIHKIEERHEN